MFQRERENERERKRETDKERKIQYKLNKLPIFWEYLLVICRANDIKIEQSRINSYTLIESMVEYKLPKFNLILCS